MAVNGENSEVKDSQSVPPSCIEVNCKSSNKIRRFSIGTEAGFSVNLINRKLDDGLPLALYIESVKEGEEPVNFGPNSVPTCYGDGWKLQTVTETEGCTRARESIRRTTKHDSSPLMEPYSPPLLPILPHDLKNPGQETKKGSKPSKAGYSVLVTYERPGRETKKGLFPSMSSVVCSPKPGTTIRDTYSTGFYRTQKRKRPMEGSLLSLACRDLSLRTDIYVTLLSASTIESSASNVLAPSTLLTKPSTPIPEIYDDAGLLGWGISEGLVGADPDECQTFIMWAFHKVEILCHRYAEEGKFLKWAHSLSTMAAPDEPKRRFLKWPHSASTMAAPDKFKRWSLQEEISKPFETAMERLQEEIKQEELRDGILVDGFGYTDIKQEHLIYTCQNGMHGVYQCQNALWIWPKLRYSLDIGKGPREVGLKIKERFPESDMIVGERTSINDLGFVTIELSGKWIAKSIHKMLIDGIDTWAPKLPMERVIVDYLSVGEEMHGDLFRRHTIAYALMSILEFSKVDVTIGHPRTVTTRSELDKAEKVLNRWYPYKDLTAFWCGWQIADWIVYVTPIWKREYIEKNLIDIEESITGNRHKPARTSYAGYRSCTTELDDKLLDKAITRVTKQGVNPMLLGYTAEAVLDCVFTYAYLKKHRLAECKFDINDELLKEEGNTFLNLLCTLANILEITDRHREPINKLKASSELLLGKGEGWEKGGERTLGFKLLEFTEILEESCLCVLPHILCEYLYDLSKKFDSYYSSVCKFWQVGFVTKKRTFLLLCEATAIVMEKCFHLLGITPTSSLHRSGKVSVTKTPLPLQFAVAKLPMDVNAWDPPGNSRFEVFSFLTTTAKYLGSDKAGKLFGVISVSDKYGLVSDVESHFYEPDFGHVTLFNHSWCNPINRTDSEIVYLGNPSSRHSVPFSYSVEIRMELHCDKNEDGCYQLCNHKIKLDLSDFWDKKADSACGELHVHGEEGYTYMHYILLKDAVDAALEVKFETETPDREVRGCVLAYYGDDFLTECKCPPSDKYSYMALLFRPTNLVLKPGEIQLIKSVLAVPTRGSLVIKAYLEDATSGEVIMDKDYRFKSQLLSCSEGRIKGEDCHLDLKVNWKYQA